MINQQAVENVVRALVEATTDSPEKLQRLMSVLADDGPKTGLGYIVANATKSVAQKLVSVS